MNEAHGRFTLTINTERVGDVIIVPFNISGYRIAGGLLWEPKHYHGAALFGRTALTSQDY